MMESKPTISQILSEIPPAIAAEIEARLKDAPLTSELTKDEALEIIDGIVRVSAVKAAIDKDEFFRTIDLFTKKIRDNLVGFFL